MARRTVRIPGGPRISREVEALIVRLERENAGWGYDRIAGALAHLTVSDQTIENVLRRHGEETTAVSPGDRGIDRIEVYERHNPVTQ
jgi:hypothetical protein